MTILSRKQVEKQKFKGNSDIPSIAERLGEGNIGARSVVASMLAAAETSGMSAFALYDRMLFLNDLGVFGEHFWILSRDVCRHDPMLLLAMGRRLIAGDFTREELVAALEGPKPERAERAAALRVKLHGPDPAPEAGAEADAEAGGPSPGTGR